MGHLCCAMVTLGPFQVAPATPAIVAVLAAATVVFLVACACFVGRLAWLHDRRWYVWVAVVVLLAPVGVPVAIAVMHRDAARVEGASP